MSLPPLLLCPAALGIPAPPPEEEESVGVGPAKPGFRVVIKRGAPARSLPAKIRGQGASGAIPTKVAPARPSSKNKVQQQLDKVSLPARSRGQGARGAIQTKVAPARPSSKKNLQQQQEKVRNNRRKELRLTFVQWNVLAESLAYDGFLSSDFRNGYNTWFEKLRDKSETMMSWLKTTTPDIEKKHPVPPGASDKVKKNVKDELKEEMQSVSQTYVDELRQKDPDLDEAMQRYKTWYNETFADEKRLNMVASVLDAVQDVSVITMQEVDTPMMDTLKARLRDFAFEGVDKSKDILNKYNNIEEEKRPTTGGKVPHQNVVAYNKMLFEKIGETMDIDISESSDNDSFACGVLLNSKQTNLQFYVVSAHLSSGQNDSKKERARKLELSNLMQHIEKLQKDSQLETGKEIPVLIGADFNSFQTPSANDKKDWSCLYKSRDSAVSSVKIRGITSDQPSKIGEPIRELLDNVWGSTGTTISSGTRSGTTPEQLFADSETNSSTGGLLLPTATIPSDHLCLVADVTLSV
jgi:endonuclease/exonuclease/phosphatase family metal-dependent hydrolase